MKSSSIATVLLVLASALVALVVADDECVNEPRCYCAGTADPPKSTCDPTQRVTMTAPNTTEACVDYCKDDCGEDAGSKFVCATEDLMPCNEGATTCQCMCEHNVTVPSPIQFVEQCGAFCAREDVCGAGAGFSYSCHSAGYQIGATVASGILVVLVASFVA